MGQIKNIKLHIVTDIKHQNQHEHVQTESDKTCTHNHAQHLTHVHLYATARQQQAHAQPWSVLEVRSWRDMFHCQNLWASQLLISIICTEKISSPWPWNATLSYLNMCSVRT